MPASPLRSEAVTRKRLIDEHLRRAGWRIQAFAPSRPLSAYDGAAVEEYPTQNGPADYALVLGGHIVGIIEAKKLSLGPQNVLSQAQRYSKGISPGGSDDYGVPLLYSTNGEVIWHQDVRDERNRSRE